MTTAILDLHREAYRALRAECTYDTGTKAAFDAAALMLAGPAPTAADWVKAGQRVRLTCGRCAGTGGFVTYVENGQPKGPGGMCFRCQGRGYQTAEDGRRNAWHDRHYMGRAA